MKYSALMLATCAIFGIGAAAIVVAPSSVAQGGSAAPLAIRASEPTLKWGPCPPVFPGKCSIAVLHGNPAQPNADVFLRIAGGYDLPVHRHSSAERMILVGGRLRVQYRGSAPTVLAPGDYAFGPAGLAHKGKCLSRGPCTLFIAFEGPVDAELDGAPID